MNDCFVTGEFRSDNWIHTTEKCSDNKHSDWVLVIGLLREQKGSKSIIFWDETRGIKSDKIAKKVESLHGKSGFYFYSNEPSTRNKLSKNGVARRTCKRKMTSFAFQESWPNEAVENDFSFPFPAFCWQYLIRVWAS